jgi:hypothetical protein
LRIGAIVRFVRISFKKAALKSSRGRLVMSRRRGPASGWAWGFRWRRQLCEFSEVLGGGCEVELIAGAVRSSEAKAVQAEDAFEMGEQHLDLLAEPG